MKFTFHIAFYGANEVDIYNFLALITIDTNINQFIKVYHNFFVSQCRSWCGPVHCRLFLRGSLLE